MKNSRPMKSILIGLSLVFALTLTACNRQGSEQKSTPPTATSEQSAAKITDVDLGRSLNPDRSIADNTNAFSPADTIYVSIKTGASTQNAELQARWLFEDGQVIDETRQSVGPTAEGATTEFHVSKPGGWPTGEYKVEISIGGTVVETRGFKVS